MKFTTLADRFMSVGKKISEEHGPASRFRARAYYNVANYLKYIEGDVSKKRINELKLTEKMKKVAVDLWKKKTNTHDIYNELTNFMGIGPSLAKKLISMGIKSVSQLKQKKYYNLLNEDTKLYLELKPVRQIKRSIIAEIDKKIGMSNTTIVGSYRRKLPYSKDIDIMLVSKLKNSIHKYISKLRKKKLKLYPYAEGDDKVSTIIIFNNKAYKLDIFRVEPENKVPMLLYSTGSKAFNIRMRALARRKGYLLNQYGMYKDGKRIPLKTEKEYFSILGMKYISPEKRSM